MNKSMENHHDVESYASSIHDMPMYFHFGYKETILFDFWRTDSLMMFSISCLIAFLIAGLYEGLRSLREFLFRKATLKQVKLNNEKTNSIINNELNTDDAKTTNTNENEAGTIITNQVIRDKSTRFQVDFVTSERTLWINLHHLLQTFLYMLQITLSFIMMLIVMTYNLWLCASIIAGATLGYLIFSSKKLNAVNDTTCH